MRSDILSNTKAVQAFGPDAISASADGTLIAVGDHTGQALFHLAVLEDDTITGTLTITVHNVVDDSEALVSGNQVAAFTVITGQNDTGLAIQEETIGVNLQDLKKENLQVKLVEGGTWTGGLGIVAVLGGSSQDPSTITETIV